MNALELMIKNLDYLDWSEIKELRSAIERKLSNDPTNLEIYEMMLEGRKLAAIKLCKERKEIGLKEAKDYCESLWDSRVDGAKFEKISEKFVLPY